MIDIIDEISAELQKENIMKYARYALCVVLIIILGSSIYAYMSHRSSTLQEEISTEYYKLFETPAPDRTTRKAEIQAFIKKRKNNIYGSLAAIRQSDALIAEERKYDDAAKTLLEVINSAKRAEIVNVAKIRLADLALNYNLTNYKGQAIAALQNGLTKDGFMVNVMKIMLGELLMDVGEQDKARAVLYNLTGGDSPEDVKFIANVLLGK